VSSTSANVHNLPTFDWPKAPFPQWKYPFAKYERENVIEEERCLDEIENIIKTRGDVGAIIVEPISSIENQMASPVFF